MGIISSSQAKQNVILISISNVNTININNSITYYNHMHTTPSRENYMPEDLSIRSVPTMCIYCKGTGRSRSSLRTCIGCKGIGTYLVVRPIAELRLLQRIRSKP